MHSGVYNICRNKMYAKSQTTGEEKWKYTICKVLTIHLKWYDIICQ